MTPSSAQHSNDPFVHLPALRDRVKDPLRSELRVTAEVMAMWDERAKGLGRPAHWRPTDQQMEHSRRQALGDAEGARADWEQAKSVDPNSSAADLAEQNLALLEAGPRR